MPILEIELVASDLVPGLPAGLTQVFGAARGTVWVKLWLIPPEHYAEDHGKPEGDYPVFVTVLKSRVPEGKALEDEISRLTQAIAIILNRPETNVHIFYQPDGAGRVAFGGKLVR